MRAFLDLLVVPHRARLLEQLVDERGLAMVDMGDDGDIADVHGLPLASEALDLLGWRAYRRGGPMLQLRGNADAGRKSALTVA